MADTNTVGLVGLLGPGGTEPLGRTPTPLPPIEHGGALEDAMTWSFTGPTAAGHQEEEGDATIPLSWGPSRGTLSWVENMTAGTLEEAGNFTSSANSTGMDLYDFYQREQVVFIIILFIFIVVGNLSVLIAIGLSKRGQRSRMNFFIMHLAIADLSCGMFNVLIDIGWKITLEWYAGNVMCKIAKYLQAVVTYGSTYVLVSLSIDRLDAIARPMHFTGSGTRAKILIILAWSLAATFSLPMIFINNEKIMTDGTTQCHTFLPEPWHWKLYMTLIALALFIIPAFIIAICYITIIVIIWSKSKLMVPTSAPSRSTSSTFKRFNAKQNGLKSETQCLGSDVNKSSSSSRGVIPQAKIRTIKMTLVIVMVFILCWSPYFIFDLLQTYGHIPQNQGMVRLSVFIQSLAPLNSAANPLIYGIFSTRICRNLRQLRACDWLLTRLCCCCPCFDSSSQRSQSVYSPSMTCTTLGEEVSMTSRHDVTGHLATGATSGGGHEREVLLRNLHAVKSC